MWEVDFWPLVTFSNDEKCFSEHWRFFSSASISLHLKSPRIYVFAFYVGKVKLVNLCVSLSMCLCCFLRGRSQGPFCLVIVVGERVEVEDLVRS